MLFFSIVYLISEIICKCIFFTWIKVIFLNLSKCVHLFLFLILLLLLFVFLFLVIFLLIFVLFFLFLFCANDCSCLFVFLIMMLLLLHLLVSITAFFHDPVSGSVLFCSCRWSCFWLSKKFHFFVVSPMFNSESNILSNKSYLTKTKIQVPRQHYCSLTSSHCINGQLAPTHHQSLQLPSCPRPYSWINTFSLRHKSMIPHNTIAIKCKMCKCVVSVCKMWNAAEKRVGAYVGTCPINVQSGSPRRSSLDVERLCLKLLAYSCVAFAERQ